MGEGDCSMSALYGTLKGKAKTIATRCGTKNSPIVTMAASWAGAVRVEVYIDADGTEKFEVIMCQWHGNGDYRVLCSGLVGKADSVMYSIQAGDL